MIWIASRLLLPALLLAPLWAQDRYPHHNFTFGAGAGMPRADLAPVLEDSPGIGIGYGYRFNRYLQADIGLDMVFGAAQIRDYLDTGIGSVRIRDREYFPTFGGRAILPLVHGRFLISGGGGGAWLKYAERVSQPSDYYRVDCPVCTSRDGWGYYALGNASYFFNRWQNFRVGVTVKSIRGHTNGEPIGPVPGFQTRDRWTHVFGEIGFSF
jgi:hypothetical protein